MKRLLLLFTACALSLNFALAQKRVSGTVTQAEDNSPLQGVAVLVKGTTVGAYTDENGKFSLEAPEDATALVFSFVGRETKEVPITGEVVNVSLSEQAYVLDEVIVTALNINREKRSLGYAAQEVSGDKASMVRDQNLVSALAGKVAGVQVLSATGAGLGGSANIRIRGANSLSGGSPLFVVDGTPISNANFSDSYRGNDYGNIAQDINMDDVESITVLKGPAATALYGNRAASGVILVTTKKGTRRQGIGVDFNSSVSFDNVYIMPDYQNEYAGGYTQEWETAIDPVDGREYKVLRFSADESWGPKIDGTLYRPWWTWYPGTPDYGKEVPLTAHPDNVRNFYETGVTFNNNVSFAGGNENTSFRLSYTNVDQTGVFPNSSLKRNNINLNASTKLSDRLELAANVNISNTNGHGRPQFGYVGNNPALSFNQWFQRQLDIDRLRDYRNEDGTFRSWNIRSATNLRPLYWDSPFFSVYENYSTDSRDRYFGNISLTYNITDHLSIKGVARRDNYTVRVEERIASGGLDQDSYSEVVRNGREDNFEFLLQYDKHLGDVSLNANVGGNLRINDYHSNTMATAGGLNAPNLFNIKASTDRPNVSSYIAKKQVQSLYGSVSFGWRDMLYIDGTLRNDWASSLPTDRNSYLYPSIAGSFIVSELWGDHPVFSFVKVRASFAQVGSDIADFSRNFNPYQTSFTYQSGTPYGSLSTFTLPNTLINENLKPALSSSYEFGLDLRFLNNRIGLDVSYYNNQATDQILTLQVPGSSGFGNALINAGNITSEGVEIALFARPVESKDFSWDLNFNIAKNESRVVELADGLDNVRLDGWGWGGFSINAPVGGEWGMMRGTAFKRHENGGIIITENGYAKERNQDLGSFLPDWTGGWRNTFTYKGIELSTFVEFQIGGQFHSITKMFNAYSGLSQITVGTNDKGKPVRDPVDQGGGIRLDGVNESGEAVTYYVDPQVLYEDNMFALHEAWIYDQSYVKLREVRLAYNFPGSMLSKLPFQNLSVAFIGKNLWLIHANVDGIDPSEISPGSNPFVFQENGILPSVRTMGINLKFGF